MLTVKICNTVRVNAAAFLLFVSTISNFGLKIDIRLKKSLVAMVSDASS